MNGSHGIQTNESSLWLQNLIDGLAGTTIKAKHAVSCEASPFQKIEVFDTYSFGRVMLLGGTLVFTERDEHVYNEMIAHPAMLCHPSPGDVCVVGGGDGGGVREVLKHKSVDRVTAVEIDRMVTDAVKKYFPGLARAFKDKRVKVVFDDGYAWLQAAKKKFDVILVDSYDPGGPVQSLETANFFEVVRNSLKKGGLAVFQTDAPDLYHDKIARTARDLSAQFAWQKPYLATIPSFPLGVCSFILCGCEGEGPAEPKSTRLEAVSKKCRYYCADIHSGAFRLPRSVEKLFG